MPLSANAFRAHAVFMFPGQGTLAAGALQNLYQAGAWTRHCIDDVFEAVGVGLTPSADGANDVHVDDLRQVLLTPSVSDTLPSGHNQLAHFVASVALVQVLHSAGVYPRYMLAQSLGEIAAMTCAGALAIPHGIRAVTALNRACRHLEGQGAMVIVAASLTDTYALLDRVGQNNLHVACINTPKQTIVSGPNPAVETLLSLDGAGLPKRFKLSLPYMSHHPDLKEEAEQFYQAMADLPLRPPDVPVYSCVARRLYADTDDLKRGLANCLIRPAYFPEALTLLPALEAPLYLHVGVSDTLARCVRAVLPDAHTLAPLAEPFEQLIQTLNDLRGAQ